MARCAASGEAGRYLSLLVEIRQQCQMFSFLSTGANLQNGTCAKRDSTCAACCTTWIALTPCPPRRNEFFLEASKYGPRGSRADASAGADGNAGRYEASAPWRATGIGEAACAARPSSPFMAPCALPAMSQRSVQSYIYERNQVRCIYEINLAYVWISFTAYKT